MKAHLAMTFADDGTTIWIDVKEPIRAGDKIIFKKDGTYEIVRTEEASE